MVEPGRKSEEEGVSRRRKEIMSISSSSPATCYKGKDKASPPPNYYDYPPPLQKYEVVASNPKVFMETLKKLHATMGTKFMIPIIGGNELDLHRLFVEVTSRGGIEKVIRERRWKEVTAVFSFPSTATNASFVLRKYYVSLIHHYEQIYFFGAKGCTITSAGTQIELPIASFALTNLSELFLPFMLLFWYGTKIYIFFPLVAARPSLGCSVVGVIDGKFEHGYLVTVTVGTEKLQGVLYHTPEHPTGQALQYSSIIGKDTSTSNVRRRRRRKKSEMKKRDPDHPKPNRSGYNFFFQEQHARLKPLHPGKDREISRMIGELWNKLAEPEKSVYQEKGLKDKERYRSEMEEYRERLKGQVISNAVPIQQRFAGREVEMEDADSKMEVEEGDSVQSIEYDHSSTSESETENEKTVENNSEMDVPVEAGNNGTESGNVAPHEPVTKGGDLELEKRNEKVGQAIDVQGSSSENAT
ncbi:ARID/BRIGHT DNA-binding domain [Macleaya cordata]|uniref:ARID/BRIGHT DNA-binding domain n=1 Tax=Macleaya cordata TaxID=56857 RepID=A0A200PZK0_MACCD|nr:ARID/BRIGHT DNA-binding domain [Macleaya cordata]